MCVSPKTSSTFENWCTSIFLKFFRKMFESVNITCISDTFARVGKNSFFWNLLNFRSIWSSRLDERPNCVVTLFKEILVFKQWIYESVNMTCISDTFQVPIEVTPPCNLAHFLPRSLKNLFNFELSPTREAQMRFSCDFTLLKKIIFFEQWKWEIALSPRREPHFGCSANAKICQKKTFS